MSDPDIKKAEEIYNARLSRLLEPACNGKYVAIDVVSGDYFLGEEILEAYQKASRKHPGRTFIFKRVGSPATRFMGSR